MMTVKKGWSRFCQFGGARLLLTYARMGMTGTVCRAVWQCVWKRVPPARAYVSIAERTNETLTARYLPILSAAIVRSRAVAANCEWKQDASQRIPKILWTCWLQGTDRIPDLVTACLDAQRKALPDYEQRVLTWDNYRQWVEVPQGVEQKYLRGHMPPALFSDVLRLAVLSKYGGVWMDASVYCSGFGHDRLRKQWSQIEASELSLFRYFDRGDGHCTGLSNWFIAARPGHAVISAVLEMICAYWRDYDCTVNYYMMHHFLGMTREAFPHTWASMPRLVSNHSILLGGALGRKFNTSAWEDLTAHVSIHKLNYRKAEASSRNPRSYYWKIVEDGLRPRDGGGTSD